jgi:hypothetical protein
MRRRQRLATPPDASPSGTWRFLGSTQLGGFAELSVGLLDGLGNEVAQPQVPLLSHT